jgi:sugar phosphate isomerase/epimerase
MGCVDMKDYTDALLELVREGKKETPKYEKLCQEVLIKREEKKERAMENAYDLLRRLVKEAEPRGIKLGIENREALEEIPFETDYMWFFKEFTSPSVVYWHDTGHAQIKENLGFIHHRLHLDSLRDRLHGFHIHDVQFPGKDHRAPGAGMIDFAGLKELVKPAHLKIFEFSPSLSVEEVKKGVVHIKGLWGNE